MPGAGPLGTDATRHDEVREPSPFVAPTRRRARARRGTAAAVQGTDAKGQLASVASLRVHDLDTA